MASPDATFSTGLPSWLARWSLSSPAKLPDNIVASEISAVEDPVHTNQRVEKSFTIFTPHEHDTADTNKRDQDLKEYSPGRAIVGSPGPTVVRVRPQLVDEAGPDVVARVRVSSDAEEHLERLTVELSDKHVLTLGYNASENSTVGHLVTEIDVPRESEIHQVVAMCGGDVVVHDGVLGRTVGTLHTEDQGSLVSNDAPLMPGGLISMYGSRLFLTAPRSELRFHTLVLGAMGTSSIHIETKDLTVTKDLLAGVLGGGRIDLNTQHLEMHSANIAALGGGSVSTTSQHAFHAANIAAYVKGDGLVRVATPMDAAVEASLSQKITVSRGGTVDLADVPSVETAVTIDRPAEGVARIRSPAEKLTIDCPSSEGALIQHIGALPAEKQHSNSSALLAELYGEDLVNARAEREASDDWRSSVPTIESAFEIPVALEKPREGWFLSSVAPAMRCLLPF